MKYRVGALLVGSTMLAAGAAAAETTYIVDKVTITGSRSVPTEKLMDAIQERKGSQVTKADIVADQDAIMKVLAAANVVGNIKTSIAATGKHVAVTFAVNDQGVQAPVVTTVAPTLHGEIFDGNKAISTDKLVAASGLTPGQKMTNEKLLAAETAIGDAYKAAKLPINMSLKGETNTLPGGKVDVTWHIVETKAKRKHEADAQGEKLEQ